MPRHSTIRPLTLILALTIIVITALGAWVFSADLQRRYALHLEERLWMRERQQHADEEMLRQKRLSTRVPFAITTVAPPAGANLDRWTLSGTVPKGVQSMTVDNSCLRNGEKPLESFHPGDRAWRYPISIEDGTLCQQMSINVHITPLPPDEMNSMLSIKLSFAHGFEEKTILAVREALTSWKNTPHGDPQGESMHDVTPTITEDIKGTYCSPYGEKSTNHTVLALGPARDLGNGLFARFVREKVDKPILGAWGDYQPVLRFYRKSGGQLIHDDSMPPIATIVYCDHGIITLRIAKLSGNRFLVTNVRDTVIPEIFIYDGKEWQRGTTLIARSFPSLANATHLLTILDARVTNDGFILSEKDHPGVLKPLLGTDTLHFAFDDSLTLRSVFTAPVTTKDEDRYEGD